jgi:glycosyltransferase involved in cell wall biosynthesis
MKVGILGSRGIPNRYGGFEQFAEYLSQGLLKLGADVWVYNSHMHPFQKNKWNGVNIIHCYDPEDAIGAVGQFIYDFNCIRDSRKRGFDLLLQLGYTSNSIWFRMLPKKASIITNMDGIEWKRSKYSSKVKKFLKFAESLAVKSSHQLVADSEAIKEYLDKKYRSNAVFIPYGAEVFNDPIAEKLKEFGLEPYHYFLLIARMQPDNHVEEIIKGVLNSETRFPLVVVGNMKNKFGEYLLKNYNLDQIRFVGGIFDEEKLNQLRFFSKIYFHGHSAGGTNPSLLEAMAASASVCAHNNPFNQSVLGTDAGYFTTDDDISKLINSGFGKPGEDQQIYNNLEKIRNKYSWDKIIKDYFDLFNNSISKS